MVLRDIQAEQLQKSTAHPMDERAIDHAKRNADTFHGLLPGDMTRIKHGYMLLTEHTHGAPFIDGAIVQISNFAAAGAFVYGGSDRWAYVPAKFLGRVNEQ